MKKILIVEDDLNIARALAIRLEAGGYKVTVAPDTVTGVDAALKIQPDLTLLDISMPVVRQDTFFGNTCLDPNLSLLVDISVPAGNGFTVAAKIRELVVTATPIIFLTASKQPGLRERAQTFGAAGFFEKPYDAEELLAAIKGALSENEVTKQ